MTPGGGWCRSEDWGGCQVWSGGAMLAARLSQSPRFGCERSEDPEEDSISGTELRVWHEPAPETPSSHGEGHLAESVVPEGLTRPLGPSSTG